MPMTSRLWSRRARVAVPAVVLLGAVAAWWLRPGPSDRELIAEVVRQAEHGVETKDVGEIMSCVSPDYRDSEGLTRTEVFRLALAWSKQRQTAQVSVEDYAVEVTPLEATATLTAVVTPEGQGEVSPMRLHVTVQFRKERRGLRRVWLVRSVEGHQLGRILEGTD